MNHVYINDRIIERINLPMRFVNQDLDKRILTHIVNKIGDKCIETGYIKSKDIEIIGRTSGQLDISHFTGDIIFDVECKVNVFNPPEGSVIFCKVINKNKMGIIAETVIEKPSPIRILLAREHHLTHKEFHDLEINNKIYVEVIAKRYEYNDTQIQAIGILSTLEELIKQNPTFKPDKEKTQQPTKSHVPIVSDSSSSYFAPTSPAFDPSKYKDDPLNPPTPYFAPGYSSEQESPIYNNNPEISYSSHTPSHSPPKTHI